MSDFLIDNDPVKNVISQRTLRYLLLGGILVAVFIAGFRYTSLTFFENSSKKDPVSDDTPFLSFSERWNFTASLDNSTYYQADNLTLSVDLTCLVTHNVTYYIPGWFRWLKILNNNGSVVWHPTMHGSITYANFTFSEGAKIVAFTDIFQLGPSTEPPPEYGVDPISFDPEEWHPALDYWIPALPLGLYSFIIDFGPLGIAVDSDPRPLLSLPFEIIINP
ncbi:MAG: hypothetical protein ACW97Z_04340 [Candidatus Hodarchaeales archaeon]